MTDRSPFTAISEVTITSPVYRTRTWWAPVTVGAVTVVSAVQMTLESTWFDTREFGEGQAWILLGHAVAGAVCAIVAAIVSAVRAGTVRPPFLPYSERFLIGLALGIITSLSIAVSCASIGADSLAEAVQGSGYLMTLSLLSLEMPVACVVGGLTWHLLSKARGGAPAPARPRRPIEDPE